MLGGTGEGVEDQIKLVKLLLQNILFAIKKTKRNVSVRCCRSYEMPDYVELRTHSDKLQKISTIICKLNKIRLSTQVSNRYFKQGDLINSKISCFQAMSLNIGPPIDCHIDLFRDTWHVILDTNFCFSPQKAMSEKVYLKPIVQ